MPSPIAQHLEQNGEDAWIIAPDVVSAYDPHATTNYQPGEDQPGIPVRGAPEGRLMREDYPDTATDGITISGDEALGSQIIPLSTKLKWRGKLFVIASVRTRHYRGEVDGYTLYLQG